MQPFNFKKYSIKDKKFMLTCEQEEHFIRIIKACDAFENPSERAEKRRLWINKFWESLKRK